MQVWRAGGGLIGEVAAQSYALTLWTFAHIRQLDKHESIDRLGNRVDMAGMVAMAFHEPKRLEGQQMRYLSAAGLMKGMATKARTRARQVLEEVARAKPVPPPGQQ